MGTKTVLSKSGHPVLTDLTVQNRFFLKTHIYDQNIVMNYINKEKPHMQKITFSKSEL